MSIISGPLFLPEKEEKTGKAFVKYEVSRCMDQKVRIS